MKRAKGGPTALDDFRQSPAELAAALPERQRAWAQRKVHELIAIAVLDETFARWMCAEIASSSLYSMLPKRRRGRPTKWNKVARIQLLAQFEALSTRMKKGQAEEHLAMMYHRYGESGPRDIRKYLTKARRERSADRDAQS